MFMIFGLAARQPRPRECIVRPPMGRINYHESENHRKLLSIFPFSLTTSKACGKANQTFSSLLDEERSERICEKFFDNVNEAICMQSSRCNYGA